MNLSEAAKILAAHNYIMEAHINDQDTAFQAVLTLAQKVHDAGYHLYIVGGAARDRVLGKTPNDYDLNTDMPEEEFMKLSDPGTGRVNHRRIKDIAHIFINGEEMECCILREGNVIDQQRRCDITIGGLIWDPLTDKIIDATGMGKKDLKSHTIRITDFMKDHMLRGRQIEIMWRVFKAVAQFGWDVDEESFDIMKRMIQWREGNVHVFELLKEKILGYPHKEKAFELCRKLGVYDELFGDNPKKLSDGDKNWSKKDTTGIDLDNYRKGNLA